MIAAFSLTPIGVGESVGDLVAEAVKVVRDSGLRSETNAMFTNVEGEWDEVMPLIRRCIEAVADRSGRASAVIKIDFRPGVNTAMLSKVESLERHLGGE